MASNFEECPTGVLVDYIGNITVSISTNYNNEKGLEDNFNENDTASLKTSHGAEEQSFDCQTPFVNIGAHNIPSSHCLGSELNRKKYEVCFSKMEWRSPSPTTMSMITFEASRIVDQLDTTLETSLWEEECPLSSSLEDECFEDSSNEYGDASQNVTVTKFCNDIEKSLCFSQENNTVENSNFTLENPKVIDDNCVTEGNSGFSEISSCRDDSDIKSFRENCRTTEKVNGNLVENGVKTDEAFLSLNSLCVAECHTTTELSDVIPGESNLILEKGNGLTEESCVIVGEGCTLNEKGCSTLVEGCSTLTEGGSTLTDEGSSLNEKGSTLTEEGSTLTEEGSTLTEEGSTLTEEGSTLTEEGSTLTEEGSTLTEEGSTLTEEGSTLTEEGSTLIEEGCLTLIEEGSIPTKGDLVATEGSLTDNEERCIAVIDSCINVEENSIVTKENSIVTEERSKFEKLGIVPEDDFSESPVFSNSVANLVTKVLCEEVYYTNLDVEQNHKLNKVTPEAKITPSSMKSKLTKGFKTLCFKTPIKYKKLEEKENVLSERKISKIGQVSSNKGILSASNSKGAVVSISKSNIKASLNKSISGKTLFGRENKSTASVLKDQVKEKLDTPLKKVNLLKFQPALPKKTPVCKSYSVAETPNAAKPIRRSSSFQTRQIPNSDQIRRERSFIAQSRPENLNSRMALIQTQRIGSELQTPSKIGSYLPKSSSNAFATPSSKVKSCAEESQVPCPSFGSASKQTKVLDQNCPQVVGFKRPASTTSKTRFVSRLELPSPLPKMSKDSLSRRLFFSDNNTPLKRRI